MNVSECHRLASCSHRFSREICSTNRSLVSSKLFEISFNRIPSDEPTTSVHLNNSGHGDAMDQMALVWRSRTTPDETFHESYRHVICRPEFVHSMPRTFLWNFLGCKFMQMSRTVPCVSACVQCAQPTFSVNVQTSVHRSLGLTGCKSHRGDFTGPSSPTGGTWSG